jgi:glyoxylase-like metal-dependent hydrolase (beta-lactamase superfamily II)
VREGLLAGAAWCDSCNTVGMSAHPASFCQIQIGDIEVTFVPDGFILSTPVSSYPGCDPSVWEGQDHLLNEDGMLVMSLGALLVRTAGKQVMVDLGWGPTEQVYADGSGRIGGGALIDNLGKLGVRPDDIDAVVFSHLHRDHTGWIVDPTTSGIEGKAAQALFPQATHYLAGAEWDYWSSLEPGAAGPAPSAEQLAVLAPLVSLVDDGDTPLPGINILGTPGHTPGHLSFVISSGQERAVVLGDAVHCPIEIDQPELMFIADVDPVLAQKTRAHIEAELTQPGTITAGPHFADLVFGRLMPGQGRPLWSFPSSQTLAVAS